MKRKIIAKVSLAAAALALCLAGFSSSLRARSAEEHLSGVAVLARPSPSPEPAADVRSVEQAAEDTLVMVQKIAKPAKTEGPAAGPPSRQSKLEDEARIEAMWLQSQIEQSKQARERAEKSTNPAERQVLLKDAQMKIEGAASLTRTINGGPAPQAGNAQPSGQGQPANAGEGSRILRQFSSGALEQLKQTNQESNSAAESKSLNGAKTRSTEAFGAGRAGAGGVALYKTATMLTQLDPSKMSSAVIEDGRLVLVYDGHKLKFPPLEPEFIALAIRSVYGGEGLVKGTLLANEKNAVVLRTGKEQYGDVVWKKDFLPDLPQNLKVGEDLALGLGPGVGVLSLPEPSHDRVTYYGPLKGNLLGHVVQESDMVFSMFWYGLDWKTGKPLDPAKLPGYESAIELALKRTDKPSAVRRAEGEKPKNWWEETVWFVWTPDEISLQLTPQSSEFEFVKSTMKATVWSVVEENVRESSRAEGEFLTQHYDDFARAFPVLASLKEAAKAVGVVRWLKHNNVPLSLGWAEHYPLSRVATPDNIQRYSVYVHRDQSGKPLVENPK